MDVDLRVINIQIVFKIHKDKLSPEQNLLKALTKQPPLISHLPSLRTPVTSGLSANEDINLNRGKILSDSDSAFFPNRTSISVFLPCVNIIQLISSQVDTNVYYITYLSHQNNKNTIYLFIKNYGQCLVINFDLTVELNLIIWAHIYLQFAYSTLSCAKSNGMCQFKKNQSHKVQPAATIFLFMIQAPFHMFYVQFYNNTLITSTSGHKHKTPFAETTDWQKSGSTANTHCPFSDTSSRQQMNLFLWALKAYVLGLLMNQDRREMFG